MSGDKLPSFMLTMWGSSSTTLVSASPSSFSSFLVSKHTILLKDFFVKWQQNLFQCLWCFKRTKNIYSPLQSFNMFLLSLWSWSCIGVWGINFAEGVSFSGCAVWDSWLQLKWSSLLSSVKQSSMSFRFLKGEVSFRRPPIIDEISP